MVLTRLSHVGEVCPLTDHSYSDPVFAPNQQLSSSLQVATDTKSDSAVEVLNILNLPVEILEKCLSYLPFKKLGDIRLVNKKFDHVASNLLNSAFLKLQNQMLSRFQTTKSQMPRRESARRKHPLARESDILEILHMRLTLLQMTFGKHIERKHCCFFPGEILDEVHRILRCIKSTPNMVKVFKITDELFDLSTMAMEYFKEFIEPDLPEISYFTSDFLDMHSKFGEGSSRSGCGRLSESEDELPLREPLPQSNMVLRKRIRKIRQGMKRYNSQLGALKRELRTCKSRFADQNKQLLEYTARMEEYDKKFDESSRKFSIVLQELNKCKTELQYWRSKSPVHSLMCCSCSGRFAGESSGSGDPFSSRSSKEKKEDWNPSAGSPSSHLSGLTQYSLFQPQGVKNLESLFDVESDTSSVLAPKVKESQYSESVSGMGSSGKALGSANMCNKFIPVMSFKSSSICNKVDKNTGYSNERTAKRFSSDDDDSDLDINTVGKRVKERKRTKLSIS